jgi:hypothetical protein
VTAGGERAAAEELKAVRETLALEEGVQKSLKVAAEPAKIILEVEACVTATSRGQVFVVWVGCFCPL